MQPSSSSLFGDSVVIHRYSRAAALRDGALNDITNIAHEAGFKVPAALTSAARATLVPSDRDAAAGQSLAGRLWDVLAVLRARARRAEGSTVLFEVLVAQAGRQERLALKAIMGPGDDGEPVMTVMLPRED
jgi:hypothetical protein